MPSYKRRKLEDLYKVNPITGCWDGITGRRKHDQYHQVQINGVREYLHRIIWKHYKGDIPIFMILDHLCRNRSCCNPEHLEIVSEAENRRRGNSAKLNQTQVDDIRLLAKTQTLTSIAKIYDVSVTQISNIVKFLKWA